MLRMVICVLQRRHGLLQHERTVSISSAYLGDEEYISAESMAHYTLWFITRGNVKIKACIIKPPDTFASYGSDKKGRHIGFIGYGCFT